jgi:hypothetical protein
MYSESDESQSSDDDTRILEEIKEQLKQIADNCDGSLGKPQTEINRIERH